MNRILNAITVLLLISGAVAYEGRHFILAFPAGHNLTADGLCQIIINANTLTEVSISYKYTVDNLHVDNGSYIYDIDCSIRAEPGHSDKAVIVDSDVDIAVQVYMMIGSIGTDVPDITTMEPTTAITPASTTHGTTELPDNPGQVPNYRIVLISDWVSGEIMETNCVTQYYNQLRQKTVQMAVEVNDMIGVILCSGLTTDDIIAESVSASFFASTNSGNGLVTFTLSTEPYVLLNDLLHCAQEIAEYSKPHSTWGEPLLDPIQNCANPVFDEGVFYDGPHAWMCVTEKELEEYSTIPSYYVELEDVWTTHDGSELNPECTLKYSLSLDQRAVSMRSQINSLLGSQLCPGISGFGVVSQVTSLVGQGSNILMHIDFILSYSSASGGDVLLCAEDILQYVKIYDNWGLPLLPSEPGCPELTQEGNEFDSTNNGWICNV